MTELEKLLAANEELKAAISDVKAIAATSGKKIYQELVEQVFAAVPELIALGWTQYTPSFNDGDPCVFRYSGVHALNSEKLQQAIDDGEHDPTYAVGAGTLMEYGYGWFVKQVETIGGLVAYENLRELNGNADLLEMVFGENTFVCYERKASGEIEFRSDYYDCY